MCRCRMWMFLRVCCVVTDRFKEAVVEERRKSAEILLRFAISSSHFSSSKILHKFFAVRRACVYTCIYMYLFMHLHTCTYIIIQWNIRVPFWPLLITMCICIYMYMYVYFRTETCLGVERGVFLGGVERCPLRECTSELKRCPFRGYLNLNCFTKTLVMLVTFI